MKRILSWLVAAASFAAFAEAVPTYNALTWRVPASSIAQVDAKYVQLYATCDGVRVGSDARNVYAVTNGVVPDVGITATTVVNGEGGWDWTGRDVRAAVFAVEFLNDALGVIATSDAAGYDVLLDADALVVNQSESGVPVNAEGAHTFANVNVSPDDIWKELKSVFGAKATVIPLADASTNIVAHKVTLKDDVDAPLVLKANLGHVVIDLKGYGIVGTNAVDGTAAAGGNAIEIAADTLARETGTPTTLEILDTAEDGYRTGIVGGRGASAETGTAGGFAVRVADGVDGVTVTVGPNAIVKGGASGNSTTGTATAGAAALSGATLASGTASAGADGTALQAWATCTCTYTGAFTNGFSQVGDQLVFWKRTTDGLDAATFDFGILAGQEVRDGLVTFTVGELDVEQLLVPAEVGSLTFAGKAGGTRLVADFRKSVFRVEADPGETFAWTNLTFDCDVTRDVLCEDGMAISIDGGAFAITDCAFTNCIATRAGGAVSAQRLTGDSRIAVSRFEGNGEPGANAYGGALYASATNGATVKLTLFDTLFANNRAQRGGAVSTLCSYDGDETPVTLEIVRCYFTGNRADWFGGAIETEGDLRVEADATYLAKGDTHFTDNFAEVGGGAVSVDGIAAKLPTLVFGRGTVFEGNLVSNACDYAVGGAIEIQRKGVTLTATGVEFTDNKAYGLGIKDYGSYGGAIDATDATNTIDTCVFNGNAIDYCSTASYSGDFYYYGGAVCSIGGRTLLKNSTFRYQNIEAFTALETETEILNCVLVDNYVSEEEGRYDCYLAACEGAKVSYSAWTTNLYDGTTLAQDEYNLSNRLASVVYDGDSLRLNTNSFNAVASLGYEQPGVYDFAGVEYGSLKPGYAMGAYEATSVAAEILVTGTKTYDGHADSNNCTFACVFTDSALENDPDLGAAASLVTVTNWVYGAKDAYLGYAPGAEAPHGLEAAADGTDEEIRRRIAAGLITLSYVGDIDRRPVDEGGLRVDFAPDEYAWTGDRVAANLTVVDTLPDGEETLVRDTDFSLTYSNNVDPTSSAVAAIDTLRNYSGFTNALYHITAYFVEYAYDGVVDEAATKIHGETSGVEVVVLDGEVPPAPAGYAFDLHHSPTNGTVTRYKDGLLRLQVQYCTDANGDDIPDKYQRGILAKVINGYWTGNAAADQERWATMTDSTGLWSVSGTGTLDTAAPTAGSGLTGFSGGAWLGFVGGQLVKIADPATVDVATLQVPFLLYAFQHQTSSRSTGGSGRGFGGKTGGGGTGGSTSGTVLTDVLDQYKATLNIVSAKMKDGQYCIDTKLLVRDASSSGTVDVPLTGAQLKVYAADALGAEWKAQACTPDPDDGLIHIDAVGRSGFFKVGL